MQGALARLYFCECFRLSFFPFFIFRGDSISPSLVGALAPFVIVARKANKDFFPNPSLLFGMAHRPVFFSTSSVGPSNLFYHPLISFFLVTDQDSYFLLLLFCEHAPGMCRISFRFLRRWPSTYPPLPSLAVSSFLVLFYPVPVG